MTNTYDTSNEPLGSTAVKVLYNNASNFDDALNAFVNTWVDRFGRNRQTWWGFEQAFNEFLVNSGFEPNHLTYVDGSPLQVDRPTQLIDRAGSVYRVKMPASFPVMLTGNWATDQNLLVDVGDQSLRQALALSSGAGLVGYASGGTYPAGTVGKAIQDTNTAIDDLSAEVDTRLDEVVTTQTTADGSGREVPDSNHFMRKDLAFTKRPRPAGFSWLPFDVLGLQANGKVAVSKTALQIMTAIATLPALTTEGYVDQVGGNNANTGTLVQPWQTVSAALSAAPYVTKFTTGAHAPFAQIDRGASPSGNRVRRFIGSGDPLKMLEPDDPNVTAFRTVGDDLTTKTWTLNASAPILAQCTITAGLTPQAVMMTRFRDEFGRPKPLPLRASAADVASLGGWYFSAGVLYVRCGLNAQFDTTVKPYLKAVYTDNTTTGYLRLNGAECYFENIAFVGVFPFIADGGGAPGKAVFKNCSFWYSRVSGVIAQGGWAILDNCQIYRCRGDGVNSHVSTDGLTEARHITINTDALYCGDIDTLGTAIASNENGMSIHENGNAAVLGGRIYKSSGPGLIDTGSGTGSTGVSLWYGVHSEDSQGADPVNFDTYGVRTVWMEQCSERGDASVAPRVQNTGTVLRTGANSVRGYTQSSGGVAVAYDPLNPV
jgi:hypothetical protein